MSLPAGRLSDQGHSQSAAGVDPAGRHGRFRRRRRLVLLLSPVVLVAAAIVLTVLAARYQPVGPGSSGGGSFPGIPAGAGIHWESGFAIPTTELYVPPQRGTFALAGSIRNNGTHSVIIDAVTQPAGSPLISAGPVLYSSRGGFEGPVHVLRNLTLGPGRAIEIGMPLRTAACGFKHHAVFVASFLVRERFLFFTHTVAVPFIDGGLIVMNSPLGKPSGPDTFCIAR